MVTQHPTDLGSAGPFKVARETCGEDGQPLLLGGDEVPVDANGLEDHQNLHGFQGRSRGRGTKFFEFHVAQHHHHNFKGVAFDVCY